MRNKNIDFGARLKFLRNNTGLNQADLAEVIGLSYRSVQDHESGLMPNYSNLNKYFEYYGCDYDWMVTGKGQPFGDKNDVPIGVGEQCENYQGGSTQPISTLIKKTIEVLESGTIYTAALAQNIEAFHHGVMEKNRKMEDLGRPEEPEQDTDQLPTQPPIAANE